MKPIIFLLCAMMLFACNASKKTSAAMQFAKNPVVAHRGAFKMNKLPQNSIAALKEAIRLGCTGAEFDIHMTADDSLVINHDNDHHGLVIEKTNYAELVAIPLSNGEKLPTLREYLLAGSNNNMTTQLVLEIKPSNISPERGAQIAEKVWNQVQELNVSNFSSYISFDYGMLKRLRALDDKAILLYLMGDKSPEELHRDGINGLDYHYSVFKKMPNWIEEAKELGLILNVWTLNDEENLKLFLAHGFNYITTNEPELLLNLWNNK